MPDVLVRGVSDGAKRSLMQRASDNGRSLQSEMRSILEQASRSVRPFDDERSLISGDMRRSKTWSVQPLNTSTRLQTADERSARIQKKKRALEAADTVASHCDFSFDRFPGPVQLLEESRREYGNRSDDLLASLTFTSEAR